MTEIDKAKKTYDIPTQRLLDNMRNLDFREVIECDGKARKIRPQFFKFAQPDSQALYAYRSFNCTMDRIIRKLQRESKQPYKKTMPIEDILNISEINGKLQSQIHEPIEGDPFFLADRTPPFNKACIQSQIFHDILLFFYVECVFFPVFTHIFILSFPLYYTISFSLKKCIFYHIQSDTKSDIIK